MTDTRPTTVSIFVLFTR